MTANEAIEQSARVKRFHALEAEMAKIYSALNAMRTNPLGVCKQAPFTGNFHDSRTVEELHITFSATPNGDPAVELTLTELHFQAFEFGKFLEEKLTSRLKLLQKERDSL